MESIVVNGKKAVYEKRLAKNGEICLATKEPRKYCNGFFRFSAKDSGSGSAFVLINVSDFF
jgi:hypothetical protein